MIPGTERDSMIDGPIVWPPDPDEARSAGITVAGMCDGDRDALRDVLQAVGLWEVLTHG